MQPNPRTENAKKDKVAVIFDAACAVIRGPACEAAALRQRIVFDGRNLYDPALLKGFGFEYLGIGRGTARSAPVALTPVPSLLAA